LVGYAEAHRADVLLVCGDVLEEPRPERLAAIISRLAELLAPSIGRGMQCVFIAGNHDSVHTFELLDGVQHLLGTDAAANVHFVSRPTLIPLTADGTTTGVLVALPYPSPGVYPTNGDPRSVEQKRVALSDAVGATIDALSARAAQEHPGIPKIMAGHFLLRQAPARTGAREVAETEDVRVESPRLADFAYVALGHVHQPHSLAKHIRYSGSIDRVDFGEADEPRHVVLAEIANGGALTLEELALDPTPMRRFEISALDELAEKAQMIDDRARTLVKLELRLGRDDPASLWLAEARENFPRLVHPVELIRLEDPGPPLLTGDVEQRGPAETVRAFLADQLAGDPDAETLLAIAEEILGEEGLSRP
jgi:exonuclease SbcD